MRNFVPVLISGFLTVVFAQGQVQQPSGVVNGTVINEVGQFVAAAKVHASLVGRPMAKAIRYIETDKDGRFSIDRLEWGDYRIYAMKDAAGYADSSFSIYSNRTRATAKLSAEAPSANVIVVIGPKAGTFTGSISDAATGEPVNTAGIRIWRLKDPTDFLSTSTRPQYRILAPPNTEVGLEIHRARLRGLALPR